MSFWLVLLVVLALSIGYRAVRYSMIRRRGQGVRWSVPLVRWAKGLRR